LGTCQERMKPDAVAQQAGKSLAKMVGGVGDCPDLLLLKV